MRQIIILGIAALLFISTVTAVFAQEATATSEPPVFALAWPVPMPNAEQLAEARACNLEAVVTERYPTEIEIEELADSYEATSACDFAILALAYAQRGGDNGPSDEGKMAYVSAVESNPATAFLLPMLVNYFNVVDLVEPPDFAMNPITEVMIEYSYSGLGGTNVHYIVTIADANTMPTVTGELTVSGGDSDGDAKPITGTVDVELVQALGLAMANLVPMQSQFAEVVCFDNYPDWKVTLTFADGPTVNFATNGSNILNAGGPWQAEIDGQNYMQHSADMLTAVVDLKETLDLPFGETAAMTCGGLDKQPIDDAFPTEPGES